MSVQREVDLSGTLTSPEQARISSEVAGIVTDVRVQLGTEVRAGDVIARLDPRELQLALDRAESALRQVEAQLGIDHLQQKQAPADDQIASMRQATANRDDARSAFEQAQQLSGRGLLTQADRDSAGDAAEDRRGQLSGHARHRPQPQGQPAGPARVVRAGAEESRRRGDPGAGRRVDLRAADPAREYIRENVPVATIVQVNPLKLKTAIQEKHASLITPGQTVEFDVEAFLNRKFTGRIAYVSPAVDQATRTFAVEALVDNSDRTLKPGFFAKGVVLTRVDQNVLAGARGGDFHPGRRVDRLRDRGRQGARSSR